MSLRWTSRVTKEELAEEIETGTDLLDEVFVPDMPFLYYLQNRGYIYILSFS